MRSSIKVRIFERVSQCLAPFGFTPSALRQPRTEKGTVPLPRGGCLLESHTECPLVLFVYLVPIRGAEAFAAYLGWSNGVATTAIRDLFDWPTVDGKEFEKDAYVTSVFHLFDSNHKRLQERFPKIDEWQLVPTPVVEINATDESFQALFQANLEAQQKALGIDPNSTDGAAICDAAAGRAVADLVAIGVPYLQRMIATRLGAIRGV